MSSIFSTWAACLDDNNKSAGIKSRSRWQFKFILFDTGCEGFSGAASPSHKKGRCGKGTVGGEAFNDTVIIWGLWLIHRDKFQFNCFYWECI